MSEIKEILEKVKTEYLKRIENRNNLGLCNITYGIKLHIVDFRKIIEYIKEYRDSLVMFYDFEGNETLSPYGTYFWRVNDTKSRLDWLNKHIELNSK